jgi:hypothetical protein
MKETIYRIIVTPETIGEVNLCEQKGLMRMVDNDDPEKIVFVSYLSSDQHEEQIKVLKARTQDEEYFGKFKCPLTGLKGVFDDAYYNENIR